MPRPVRVLLQKRFRAQLLGREWANERKATTNTLGELIDVRNAVIHEPRNTVIDAANCRRFLAAAKELIEAGNSLIENPVGGGPSAVGEQP